MGTTLLGCSSAVLLWPGKAPPQSRQPPRVTALPSAAGPARVPQLELESFAPFAAEPRFQPVTDALELDQLARAAQLLAEVRAQQPATDSQSLALWNGRLWERAEQPERALPECEKALSLPGELTDYAELCVARVHVTLGLGKPALQLLSARQYGAATEPKRLLLLSRAAKLSGDVERALQSVGQAAPLLKDAKERAEAELLQAELLITRASASNTALPGARETDVELALTLLRRAFPNLQAKQRQVASELEQRGLSLLSPEKRAVLSVPTLEQNVQELNGLLEGREREEAERRAGALLQTLDESTRNSPLGCELQLIQAKALGALRRYGKAEDVLRVAREKCKADPERGPKIWFLSAKYAGSDGKSTQATNFYGEVEKLYPSDRLADDARFHAALTWLELGDVARFTEMVLSMPDAYPRGDMTREGLFRLALRRMEVGAWGEALHVLDRTLQLTGAEEKRGFDVLGRERFFKARALLALGQREPALAEFLDLVKTQPLSYYMLQSYTWLEREAPGQARAALQAAEEAARSAPFRIASPSELDRPGFHRMLELLRIGELDAALAELDVLGMAKTPAGPDLLWGIARLYERAGFSKFSADLAKRHLGEVSSMWPVNDWEKAWQLAFPRPYWDLVRKHCGEARVEPGLAYAIMREESAFDPEATSIADAYGLMQLIVPTAQKAAKGTNLRVSATSLKSPRVNIALGCRELAHLTGLFAENPLLAIPAYNAGPGRPQRWLRDRPAMDFDLWVELIPFQETRRYFKRVVSSRAAYTYLYERERSESALLLPQRLAAL
ncbi:MAG TPA: lytic transglycosylase domain-containing protein [Polyangiaceae bacterium]|nr:lytic transglycosylase domain-containing protein [Polyangiaceae bacterium]